MISTNSQDNGRRLLADKHAPSGSFHLDNTLRDQDVDKSHPLPPDGGGGSPMPVAPAPLAGINAAGVDANNGSEDDDLMWNDDKGKGRITFGTHGFLDPTGKNVVSGRRENALIGMLQHAKSVDDD